MSKREEASVICPEAFEEENGYYKCPYLDCTRLWDDTVYCPVI